MKNLRKILSGKERNKEKAMKNFLFKLFLGIIVLPLTTFSQGHGSPAVEVVPAVYDSSQAPKAIPARESTQLKMTSTLSKPEGLDEEVEFSRFEKIVIDSKTVKYVKVEFVRPDDGEPFLRISEYTEEAYKNGGKALKTWAHEISNGPNSVSDITFVQDKSLPPRYAAKVLFLGIGGHSYFLRLYSLDSKVREPLFEVESEEAFEPSMDGTRFRVKYLKAIPNDKNPEVFKLEEALEYLDLKNAK